jgi:hypothetical protein
MSRHWCPSAVMHFQWATASTQVTYVPTQVYQPGLTRQWTAGSCLTSAV